MSESPDRFEQWLAHDFDQVVQPAVGLMKQLSRVWKAVQRAQAVGDIETLSRDLTQSKAIVEQIAPVLQRAADTASTYDVKTYLDDHFDAEFRGVCEAAGLRVDGRYPRYLIYPLQVRIDTRRMGVLVNRRFHRGLRVSRIVAVIRDERRRLLDRPFGAASFLADLVAAYDGLMELEKAKQGEDLPAQDLYLRRLYDRLVPMRQWRTIYPEGFFAFDLHRLLQSSEIHARDGRRIVLSPAQRERNNLTILDSSGREVQYGLIAFRKEGGS